MKKLPALVFSWFLITTFILISTNTVWGYSDGDCVRCHKQGSSESKLQVDLKLQSATIHGREVGCTECHQGVKDDGHTHTKGAGIVICGECHEQENRHAPDGSVTCKDCHPRHAIFESEDRRSSVYWENLKNTCKTCHPKEADNNSKLNFFPSFHIASHPKQDLSMIFDKQMCLGCHQGQGAHGEDAPINGQDCYKCHIPMGNNKAVLGYTHSDTDWGSQPINTVAAYASLFGVFGFAIIGAFLGFRGSGHKRKGR